MRSIFFFSPSREENGETFVPGFKARKATRICFFFFSFFHSSHKGPIVEKNLEISPIDNSVVVEVRRNAISGTARSPMVDYSHSVENVDDAVATHVATFASYALTVNDELATHVQKTVHRTHKSVRAGNKSGSRNVIRRSLSLRVARVVQGCRRHAAARFDASRRVDKVVLAKLDEKPNDVARTHVHLAGLKM